MRSILFAAVLLVGVGCASAPVASSRMQAVTATWMLRTPFGSGSAVVIRCTPEGEGWRITALTAKHVMHLHQIKGFTMVLKQSGANIPGGTIVALHPTRDIALISFYHTEPVPVIRIASAPPIVLDPITVVGFAGGRGNRWISEGIICGDTRCTAPVAPGDSGGAVMNAAGELVGIVSGVNVLRNGAHVPHHHHYCPTYPMREWIAEH
jgi:S1-C subfamily serine protease